MTETETGTGTKVEWPEMTRFVARNIEGGQDWLILFDDGFYDGSIDWVSWMNFGVINRFPVHSTDGPGGKTIRVSKTDTESLKRWAVKFPNIYQLLEPDTGDPEQDVYVRPHGPTDPLD